MAERKFALGLDYGTNSVRALIVDIETGEEVGTSVFNFPSGKDGVLLDERDPHFARQNPRDYIEGLEVSVKGALADAAGAPGFSPEAIIGIGIDTTGSSPIPVGADGMPLSFDPRFKDNPNAMVWLWKDHTSHAEAGQINELAHKWDPDFTKYSGGIYSSEWYFSKILVLSRVDPEVFEAAASFVEHCDWMPALLVGETNPARLKRSRCAAGHKAMWNAEWDGLPSEEFLVALSSRLKGLRAKLYNDTYTADVKVGGLSKEWAGRLGLQEGIAVAGGAFDAHFGGVGATIAPGTLVKIMGTSTCDVMVAPDLTERVEGICGQVDGSVVPGMEGLEAGQSAVGDIFAWWRDQMRWPLEQLLPRTAVGASLAEQVPELMEEAKDLFYAVMTQGASKLKAGESGLLALDWLNGNRTVLVDPNLTGLVVGLTLGTKPEELFLALVEATAYGARVIIERFEEYGVKVEQIVACGGLAEKNPLIMQVYADITGRPIKVSKSGQTCALGSAMFGAVAAGYYTDITEAQARMGGLKEHVFEPVPGSVAVYDRLYALYKRLHDAFGTQGVDDLYAVMKELLAIKRSVSE